MFLPWLVLYFDFTTMYYTSLLLKLIAKMGTRVLDNLKDYAVRALVNAVDHLGTVAYKLTDLLEQQTVDVSTMDLKVTCLNQVSFCIFVC